MKVKAMAITAIMIVAAVAVLSGCASVNKTHSTGVLIVGVENSAKYGKCPGSSRDADTMRKILSRYSYDVVVLKDGEATRANVKSNLGSMVSSKELVVFFYSGHGGQLSSGGPEEEDRKDEYLCAYDGMIKDNEIWSIVNKGKRVVLIFDCCNSGTMYRAFEFNMLSDVVMSKGTSASIWCLSGCPDGQYSYGDALGGMLTNAIKKYYSPGMTYSKLAKLVKKDQGLKKYENVQLTVIGSGFKSSTLVFR